MMTLLVGFLTAILVLVCLLLILLVLMQLPKKEAGLGTAFGSTATDALFGAGTGNALSKLTKYSTVIFIVLSVALACIGSYQTRQTGGSRLKEAIEKAATTMPAPVAPAAKSPASAAKPAVALTNLPLKLSNAALMVVPSNTPAAAPATNTIRLQMPPAAASNTSAK